MMMAHQWNFDNVSLSISHKKDIAVAIIGWKKNGTLGIDIEDLLLAEWAYKKWSLEPRNRNVE